MSPRRVVHKFQAWEMANPEIIQMRLIYGKLLEIKAIKGVKYRLAYPMAAQLNSSKS